MRSSGSGIRALVIMVLTLAPSGSGLAQQESIPTFGTTVVIPFGLRGLVYHLRTNTRRLPDLHKLKHRGKAIYTESLNIPPHHFDQGFPGVSTRFEWFAIDYTGRFWIEQAGLYTFTLTSDDGSRLSIDGGLVVDNDGTHPPRTREESVMLRRGIHTLRVEYFQGPRFQVALILEVARPGEEPRVFSTEEFKPPPNPADWILPESN